MNISNDKLYKVSQAHTVYKTANGDRVPGVTTVLGVLNKPALIKWANDLGLQGIDSTKYRDAAASIGTLVHAMVEANLKGLELDVTDFTPNEIQQAEVGFKKFIDWKTNRNFEIIASEQSLVSEINKYGGTIDCVAKVDGKVTLVDFKTGKGVYNEMFAQVSAYNELLKEHGIHTEEIMILRIGRNDDEGFEVRTLQTSDISSYFNIFKSCLDIYEVKKKVGWR